MIIFIFCYFYIMEVFIYKLCLNIISNELMKSIYYKIENHFSFILDERADFKPYYSNYFLDNIRKIKK